MPILTSYTSFKWDITPCSHAGSFARHMFRPWRWRRYVPPKHRLTLNGLHGVISQKMLLFITTAVRTSNPTSFKWSTYSISLFISGMYLCVSFVRVHTGLRKQLEVHKTQAGNTTNKKHKTAYIIIINYAIMILFVSVPKSINSLTSALVFQNFFSLLGRTPRVHRPVYVLDSLPAFVDFAYLPSVPIHTFLPRRINSLRSCVSMDVNISFCASHVTHAPRKRDVNRDNEVHVV
jgi:hypothetical protein